MKSPMCDRKVPTRRDGRGKSYRKAVLSDHVTHEPNGAPTPDEHDPEDEADRKREPQGPASDHVQEEPLVHGRSSAPLPRAEGEAPTLTGIGRLTGPGGPSSQPGGFIGCRPLGIAARRPARPTSAGHGAGSGT